MTETLLRSMSNVKTNFMPVVTIRPKLPSITPNPDLVDDAISEGKGGFVDSFKKMTTPEWLLFWTIVIILGVSLGLYLSRLIEKKRQERDDELEIDVIDLPALRRRRARRQSSTRNNYRYVGTGSNRSIVPTRLTEESQENNLKFIRPNCIIIHGVIADGNFGRVLRATLVTENKYGRNVNREIIAIKVIRAEDVSLATCNQLMKEAKLMTSFHHPNILAMRGVVNNSTCSLKIYYIQ